MNIISFSKIAAYMVRIPSRYQGDLTNHESNTDKMARFASLLKSKYPDLPVFEGMSGRPGGFQKRRTGRLEKRVFRRAADQKGGKE